MDMSNLAFRKKKAEVLKDYLKFKYEKTRLLSMSEFKKIIESYDS